MIVFLDSGSTQIFFKHSVLNLSIWSGNFRIETRFPLLKALPISSIGSDESMETIPCEVILKISEVSKVSHLDVPLLTIIVLVLCSIRMAKGVRIAKVHVPIWYHDIVVRYTLLAPQPLVEGSAVVQNPNQEQPMCQPARMENSVAKILKAIVLLARSYLFRVAITV